MAFILRAGAAFLGKHDAETEEADGNTEEADGEACGCLDESYHSRGCVNCEEFHYKREENNGRCQENMKNTMDYEQGEKSIRSTYFRSHTNVKEQNDTMILPDADQ